MREYNINCSINKFRLRQNKVLTAQIWKSSRTLIKSRNVKRLWEVFWVHLDLFLTIVADNVAGMWRECEPKWRRLMWAEFRSHCEGQVYMNSENISQSLHIPVFWRIRLDFQIWAVRTLYCFCLNLFNGTIYFIFTQPIKSWQTPCIVK